jgi:hypothetical protein
MSTAVKKVVKRVVKKTVPLVEVPDVDSGETKVDAIAEVVIATSKTSAVTELDLLNNGVQLVSNNELKIIISKLEKDLTDVKLVVYETSAKLDLLLTNQGNVKIATPVQAKRSDDKLTILTTWTYLWKNNREMLIKRMDISKQSLDKIVEEKKNDLEKVKSVEERHVLFGKYVYKVLTDSQKKILTTLKNDLNVKNEKSNKEKNAAQPDTEQPPKQMPKKQIVVTDEIDALADKMINGEYWSADGGEEEDGELADEDDE